MLHCSSFLFARILPDKLFLIGKLTLGVIGAIGYGGFQGPQRRLGYQATWQNWHGSAHTLILSFSNGSRTLRGFDISSGQMAVRAGAPVVQDLLQNNYDSRNFPQQAGRLLPFIVVWMKWTGAELIFLSFLLWQIYLRKWQLTSSRRKTSGTLWRLGSS